MLDIITIGDIKLDTFVVINDASVQCQLNTPECQLCIEYGAKIAVDIVDSQIAGSAPNVAIGLARMKKKTAVISITGEDGTREMALKQLKKESVSTEYIKKVRGEQSAYSVVLNFHGEKTILASQISHPYHLPTKLKKTKWVYVSEMGAGYETLFRELCTYKKKNPEVKIGFNPGHIQIKEHKKVLYSLIKCMEILFVNRQEAQDLTGSKSFEILHLATALFKLGPKIVVITDGKNGAYSFDGENLLFIPIFPGKRIEATGAGDSFAAGYLGAIIAGKENTMGLVWGSINSASVVGQIGPQAGLLSAGQIKSRLQKKKSYQAKIM